MAEAPLALLHLRRSGPNLLGGALRECGSPQLLAVPNDGGLEIHSWPPACSSPCARVRDADLDPVIALDWGAPEACPSLLAAAGLKTLKVFQITPSPAPSGSPPGALSVLAVATVALDARPLSLAFHPTCCVLAVFDGGGATLLDLSRPSMGAPVLRRLAFAVPRDMRCGAWAAQGAHTAVGATEGLGPLALAGAAEVMVHPSAGNSEGGGGGGGDGSDATAAGDGWHRCFGGDVPIGDGGGGGSGAAAPGAAYGQFRALLGIEWGSGGGGGACPTAAFVTALDPDAMVRAIGDGIGDLLGIGSGGGGLGRSSGSSGGGGGDRVSLGGLGGLGLAEDPRRPLNDRLGSVGGFRRTLPDAKPGCSARASTWLLATPPGAPAEAGGGGPLCGEAARSPSPPLVAPGGVLDLTGGRLGGKGGPGVGGEGFSAAAHLLGGIGAGSGQQQQKQQPVSVPVAAQARLVVIALVEPQPGHRGRTALRAVASCSLPPDISAPTLVRTRCALVLQRPRVPAVCVDCCTCSQCRLQSLWPTTHAIRLPTPTGLTLCSSPRRRGRCATAATVASAASATAAAVTAAAVAAAAVAAAAKVACLTAGSSPRGRS